MSLLLPLGETILMEKIGNEEWWRDLFFKIQTRKNLTREETRTAWNLLWDAWLNIDLKILRNRFLPWKFKTFWAMKKIDPRAVLTAPSFLIGLAAKGMTKEELMGLTDSFYDHKWFEDYMQFDVPFPNTVYSNGFGGDAINTINVSTTSMIIAAAAGAPVFKMGSRSYFSKAGSLDFLNAVGVKGLTTPQEVVDLIKKIKIAYVDGVSTADSATQSLGDAMAVIPFAQQLMKALTYPFRFPILCFNLLNARRLQRGVSTLDTEVVAEVLKESFDYIELAHVIAGMDEQGRIIDEVSNVGPTKITEIHDNKIETFETVPEDWGVKKSPSSAIEGGDGYENAKIALEIFLGLRDDAHKDLLLINASEYIYLAGLSENFKAGTELARKAIDSKAALVKLEEFVTESGGDISKFKTLVNDVKRT